MQRVPLLILLAALSFLPTLFFHTVGEEGIYTISSMEMWHNRDWLIQTMYGLNLQRPPLMNWLVIPVANLLGWNHVLVATRLVSVIATLCMVATLYWLSLRLYAQRAFALFAALSCFGLADLIIYRGWLAYTDPLFACLTFGAMATLWVASNEKHRGWLLLSVLLVSGALLTKAFTAYIFYGTAVLVLLWQRPQRAFLLSPASLLIMASALIVPAAWFMSIPRVGSSSSSMLSEIMGKLAAGDGAGYLLRLATYPLDTAIWLSPLVLLTVYLVLRKRVRQPDESPVYFQTALWIMALSILPYWLAPQGGIRYLLPIYPFIALVCARLIWRAGSQALALRWFAGIIALKFIVVLIVFPYYQSHYRGENYVVAAHDIMKQSVGYQLYADDTRSVSENIVSEIDLQRLPLPPLKMPPANWDNGFLLTMEPDGASQIFGKLRIAYDDVYLMCRGAACNAPRQLDSLNY